MLPSQETENQENTISINLRSYCTNIMDTTSNYLTIFQASSTLQNLFNFVKQIRLKGLSLVVLTLSKLEEKNLLKTLFKEELTLTHQLNGAKQESKFTNQECLLVPHLNILQGITCYKVHHLSCQLLHLTLNLDKESLICQQPQEEKQLTQLN